MSLADVALDKQAVLYRWSDTDSGVFYCDSQDEQSRLPKGSLRQVIRYLRIADTFAVSSEICEVLKAAANSLHKTSEAMEGFIIEASDLPSSVGFVHFETPIVFHDSYGRAMVVTDVQWSRATFARRATAELISNDGFAIVIYTDMNDPRDSLHEEYSQTMAQAWADIMGHFPAGWPTWAGITQLGNPVSTDAGTFLLAFFRFIQEPWIHNTDERPSRPAMRRAARADVLPGSTNVIRLRRSARSEAQEGHEEGGVDWSHRWLVRGHWRRQWYPSENRHKPRWIMPHAKGPEGKPLVVKENVFVVDR